MLPYVSIIQHLPLLEKKTRLKVTMSKNVQNVQNMCFKCSWKIYLKCLILKVNILNKYSKDIDMKIINTHENNKHVTQKRESNQ